MVMLRSSSFLKRTVWRAQARACERSCGACHDPQRQREPASERSTTTCSSRGGLQAPGAPSAWAGGARSEPGFPGRSGAHAPARPRWPSPQSTCRAPRGRWCLRGRERHRQHAIVAGGARSSLRAGRVPILIVAWRLMTSGDSGVSLVTSSVAKSCQAARRRERQLAQPRAGAARRRSASPAPSDPSWSSPSWPAL